MQNQEKSLLSDQSQRHLRHIESNTLPIRDAPPRGEGALANRAADPGMQSHHRRHEIHRQHRQARTNQLQEII